jgi:type I restriction enzyme S subunit
MREGWSETTLEGIAEVIMGQSPDGKSYNQEGNGLPFLQGSAEFGEHYPVPEKWCSDPKKIADPGDLLLSVRAPVGDTNFADQRIAVGRGLSIIRASKESLNEFIRLVIQLNVAELIASSGSGMFASITGKNLKEFKVNLPPLPEQKRIVDLISSVDSYVESLRQQLASAKRSRNAVLHELLTASDDGWVESSLGVQMSLEYGKPLTESNRDGVGFPVYGSAGIVGMHSEPLVSTAPVIIVGRKGTAGAVYWSEDQCFVIDTAYFVAPKTGIELKFLYHLLNFIDLKSVTAQTGVPGLNRERAYSLKCKIPPKSKQFEIVEMISTMDEVVNKTESMLAETQNLRSGLLSDLLSGEHEIPASYDRVMDAA